MFGTLIYAAIILGLIITLYKKPASGIALAVCMFAFDQWGAIHSHYLLTHSYISNLVVGSLITLAFLRAKFLATNIRFRGHINDFPTIQTLTILLIVFSIASTIWSPQEQLGMQKWVSQIPYFIVVALLAPHLINRPQDLSVVLKAILLLGGLYTLLFAFFTTWDNRAIIIAGHKETVALPLAIAQMSGIAFITALLAPSIKGKQWLIIRAIVAIVCIILVFKTSSRGQLIAMLGISLIFFPFSRPKINIRAYISMLIIFTFIAFFVIYAYQQLQIQDTRWSSVEMKEDIQSRFSMIGALLSHWFNGGVFTWFFGLGNSASFDTSILGFYPHNVPLEILGEEGIIGFSMFVAINLLMVKKVYQSSRYTNNNPTAKNHIILISSFYAFIFILMFKSGALYGASYLFIFPILLERYVKLLKLQTQEKIISERALLKKKA